MVNLNSKYKGQNPMVLVNKKIALIKMTIRDKVPSGMFPPIYIPKRIKAMEMRMVLSKVPMFFFKKFIAFLLG